MKLIFTLDTHINREESRHPMEVVGVLGHTQHLW